ncbi:MAG: ABC transporter ATP-binding protein [Solirubrobacteraceae bacterium]
MPIIEVDRLQKRYGDTVAVADVSFSIEEGEIFGILGPNGAGKTTTVEAIAGLREPDAGSIRVMGLDPFDRREELRRVLGIQLQESQQPDKLEVGEALDLYASFYQSAADPDALLAALGLAGKRRSRFAKLSGGQKQRLSIALGLIGNPRIAVLDELTTGLDPQARRDTWALIEGIRERGVTIVLVTHFMEEAERLADRVALIDQGRVVAVDTPAALTVSASPEQVIRFRPSVPIPRGLLDRIPEITSVRSERDQVVVSGTGCSRRRDERDPREGTSSCPLPRCPFVASQNPNAQRRPR